MEARLKLILKLIPWSLIVKTLVFAGAWWILPFGLFLIVASYLYLVPFFKPLKFLAPFLTLLALISPFFLAKSFWVIALGSATFFIILGVRELLFINRRAVYKTAYFILLFMLLHTFFSGFQNWTGWLVVFGSLATALVFFLLLKHLANYKDSPEEQERIGRRKEFVVQGLATFFAWQLLWILLFLPLNYIYQSMLGFLVVVTLTELILAYINFSLTRRKMLTNFTILFVFVIFVLASFSAGI
ncbi:MAG: hypothetical protein AAB738_03025 [Patescibacteria group bacterium]